MSSQRFTRYSFASSFCNNNHGNIGFQKYGWASAQDSNGNFPNTAACETAFDNIINQCHGYVFFFTH